MARWNLSISEEADRLVRVFLARTRLEKGDLSAFVEEACRREILRRTIRSVRKDNKDLSAEEAMALANEALAADPAPRP